MLLALLMILPGHYCDRSFNITKFTVPDVVLPGQNTVDLECKYDGDFTLLSWFKGPTEFLRYKPGLTPEMRTFPIRGVGEIDILSCNPSVCRARLTNLSEEASGMYRCDIEREAPPFHFATRKAVMTVYGFEKRRPEIKNVDYMYGEGDIMEAICIAGHESRITWFINAKEVPDNFGYVYKLKMTRSLFKGSPPIMVVKCAEYAENGTLIGSSVLQVNWRSPFKHNPIPQEQIPQDDAPQEQCSSSNILQSNVFLLFLSVAKLNIFI